MQRVTVARPMRPAVAGLGTRRCGGPQSRRQVWMEAAAGKGGRRGAASSGAGKKKKSSAAVCTSPVPMKVLEVLSDPTPQGSPLWATFCGNSAGEWHGSAVAYNPINGKAEPITLDENRKKVFELPCIAMEDRVVLEDGTDKVRRETFRAVKAADIASPEQRVPPGEDDDESPVIYDAAEIVDGEDGLVIFEAGAYSRGPVEIGSTEEADEAVVTIEQCLCWGGHERVRCELVLSTSGGGGVGEEVDIDVLRLMVFYERWEAPPGYSDPTKANCESPKAPTIVADDRRVNPINLAGEWKSFDVGSLPLIDNVDGSGERPILAYFGSETRQRWFAPMEEPSAEGISLWLPGRIAVTMALSPGYSAADSSDGDNLGVGGVVFGLGWMVKDGTWIGLERDYSGEGVLREVRSSSACQGGWVGGAM